NASEHQIFVPTRRSSDLKEDIIGTWAGLRPLIKQEGKSTRDTPRYDEIWKIKEGLFTIAGGKLTTYRKMADRVLKKVSKDMPHRSEEHTSELQSRFELVC